MERVTLRTPQFVPKLLVLRKDERSQILQLVAFIEIPEGNFYRGGELSGGLIRITLQNMMGSFSTIQKDNEFLPAVKAVWKPWVSCSPPACLSLYIKFG